MTKHATVVIDKYKLGTFTRVLGEEGFRFEVSEDPLTTNGSGVLITVYYTMDRFLELVRLVKGCNAKAKEDERGTV